MNLTLEEAIALRNFLEQMCVSYYEVHLRAALSKIIRKLNEHITELEEPPRIEEVDEEIIIEDLDFDSID